MNSETPPVDPPDSPVVTTSVMARMLNVFAAPGDVFNEVRQSAPNTANWLMPAILLMVVGWACHFLVMAQPETMQQINAMAERGIQQQVEAGKLTQAQADVAHDQAIKFAGISARVAGILAPPAAAFATPFWWGLLLWLLGGKLLKGGFSFMKAVEVAGLSSMILVLEAVLKTLLILATGNLFAGPGPVLLIRDFDAQNLLHGVLAKLSLTTLWVLAVRAVGIARLGAGSFARSAGVVFGFWILWNGLWTGIGLAIASLLQR
ncbi:MAG: YIP1 family protein [Verrucomicrobiales bacterium]|nr:YIP1 family protein [Verrucomicrobiales bacterium]MCP5526534.1 YIP1 family protein [Verrucomicrobiales bacterium]